MNATPPQITQETVRIEIEGAVKTFLDDVKDRLNSLGFDVAVSFHSRAAGVRESIIELVKECDYLTSAQIADQLQDKIITKSTYPRRIVLTTVSALCREMVLRRDSLGRISVAQREEKAVTA